MIAALHSNASPIQIPFALPRFTFLPRHAELVTQRSIQKCSLRSEPLCIRCPETAPQSETNSSPLICRSACPVCLAVYLYIEGCPSRDREGRISCLGVEPRLNENKSYPTQIQGAERVSLRFVQ